MLHSRRNPIQFCFHLHGNAVTLVFIPVGFPQVLWDSCNPHPHAGHYLKPHIKASMYNETCCRTHLKLLISHQVKCLSDFVDGAGTFWCARTVAMTTFLCIVLLTVNQMHEPHCQLGCSNYRSCNTQSTANLCASNLTGHQWGPKRKLRAGYRALSLKRTSCCQYFLLLNVVSCTFSALCMYSKFGHHPHP